MIRASLDPVCHQSVVEEAGLNREPHTHLPSLQEVICHGDKTVEKCLNLWLGRAHCVPEEKKMDAQ